MSTGKQAPMRKYRDGRRGASTTQTRKTIGAFKAIAVHRFLHHDCSTRRQKPFWKGSRRAQVVLCFIAAASFEDVEVFRWLAPLDSRWTIVLRQTTPVMPTPFFSGGLPRTRNYVGKKVGIPREPFFDGFGSRITAKLNSFR